MSVIQQNTTVEKENKGTIHDFIVEGTSLKPPLRHIDIVLLEKEF